ncbi:MAG: hypothetical protein QME87_09810 [Bacillota bacterium]|nr:hypothetical protein [Bacillota bacterium]
MAVVQDRFLLDGADLVRTGISPRYVPTWGVVEALREVFQEYIDVRRKYGCWGRIRWRKAGVVVEDDGPGLPRAALALGVSGKRGEDRLIGQFGEGLKLAALVAAREGRRMEIETVGFAVVPRIVRDPSLGCEVLAFEVRDNSRSRGTCITVEATRDEYLAARRQFLELSREGLEVLYRDEDGRPVIFRPAGRVFVNGCLAQEREDLLFSYDLSGSDVKQAQNRDRTVLDDYQLGRAVRDLLSGVRSARVIEDLFRSAYNAPVNLEHRYLLNVPQALHPVWREGLRRALGPRVALGDHTPADEELRVSYGYRVLERYPSAWVDLFEDLGVYYSARTLADLHHRSGRRVDLTARERAVLDWIRQVVATCVADPGRVEVVEYLVAGNVQVDGCWDSGARVIRLRRSVLADPKRALGALVHEVLHRESGASDCTRSFEAAWERLAVELILHRVGGVPELG